MHLPVPCIRPRVRRFESGQILTEAAIGLSLMSLTWILLAFTSFMATNHLRTSMAARYAAWYRGEALESATTNQVRKYFFYHDLVSLDYTEGVGMLELDPRIQTEDRAGLLRAASGPSRATVRFGITGPESKGAGWVPFALLWGRLPFMPETAPENTSILTFESSCQWDETGEPWNQPARVFSWIWDRLENLASSTAGKLSGAF